MRIHAHSVFVRTRAVKSFESGLPVTAISELVNDILLSIYFADICVFCAIVICCSRKSDSLKETKKKGARSKKKNGWEVEGGQAVT